MLISPSVSEILRGVTHEMETSLKQGLNDPVKNAQIDPIIGVLSSCAVFFCSTAMEGRALAMESILGRGKDSMNCLT